MTLHILLVTAISIVIVLIIINRGINAEFHEFEQETIEDIVNLKHQMQLYTRKTAVLEHKLRQMEDRLPPIKSVPTSIDRFKWDISPSDWFSKS